MSNRRIVCPPDRPDLRSRVTEALTTIGERLPRRIVRLIERSPPQVRIVPFIKGKDELHKPLGCCRGKQRVIEIAAAAVDHLSDDALVALVLHELCHFIRFLEGHKVDEADEEWQTHLLMESFGFADEQATLNDEADGGNIQLWEAVARGAFHCIVQIDADDFFPPAPTRRYRE